MQANVFLPQNLHKWMALQDDAMVALWGLRRRRNGNAIGSCLRCCSEDIGTLPGESAVSLQAMPQQPYGRRFRFRRRLSSTARAGMLPSAFDTKPLRPYNAPLVRANSASAIILLWAFCPHPTHSARRRFRRALTRLALFFVSNGVLGVFCLVVPRGPAVRACACATEDRMRTIHLHI